MHRGEDVRAAAALASLIASGESDNAYKYCSPLGVYEDLVLSSTSHKGIQFRRKRKSTKGRDCGSKAHIHRCTARSEETGEGYIRYICCIVARGLYLKPVNHSPVNPSLLLIASCVSLKSEFYPPNFRPPGAFGARNQGHFSRAQLTLPLLQLSLYPIANSLVWIRYARAPTNRSHVFLHLQLVLLQPRLLHLGQQHRDLPQPLA